MLQINLIPIERRRKEKTPLPRFVVIISAVVIALGLLIWDVKTVLDTKKIKADIAEKQKELQSLQSVLTVVPGLKAEKEELDQWRQAADKVANLRSFKWWHSVDILWDIFAEFPTVWINSFQFVDKGPSGRGASKPIEAMTKFDCFSLGDNTETMTNFRRRLKGDAELKQIFTGGINENVSFDVRKLSGSGDEWAVSFKIELYRETPPAMGQ